MSENEIQEWNVSIMNENYESSTICEWRQNVRFPIVFQNEQENKEFYEMTEKE